MLDTVQHQPRGLCCRAMKITPTSALQVETGEMALEMQRLQLVLIYEANLEGQPSSTSIIRILPREGKMGVKELWLNDRRHGEFGLSDKKMSPMVPFSLISPWALEDA